MRQLSAKKAAFKAAFPHTLPIMAGFLFLGFTYGLYMHSLGFGFLYPTLMAMFIYGGSLEFVAASMLLSGFKLAGDSEASNEFIRMNAGVTAEMMDADYIQDLIDHIQILQDDENEVDKAELDSLNEELDTILKRLGAGR